MKFSKKAFTLAEVLIGILITTTVVLGMLVMFTFPQKNVSRGRRKLQAMYFAHTQLEIWRNEVRADTWDSGQLAVTTGPGGWNVGDWQDILDPPGMSWASTFAAQWRYKIEDVTGLPGDYPPRSATIQVRWNEP